MVILLFVRQDFALSSYNIFDIIKFYSYFSLFLLEFLPFCSKSIYVLISLFKFYFFWLSPMVYLFLILQKNRMNIRIALKVSIFYEFFLSFVGSY